jgi:uncharacterized protein (DUF924 family)
MSDIVADDICRFWFEEVEKSSWFKQSDEFDAELKEKFGELLELAKTGDLDHWCDCAEGYLGLIVVLDQFSRNIHRDSPEAFAADEKALELAKELIDKELDTELMQHVGLKKTREINAEGYGSDKYAVGHLSIIERFGRFPHRNAVLGRENTSDEETYLAGKALGV